MFSYKKKLVHFVDNIDELKDLLQSRSQVPIKVDNKQLLLVYHQNEFHLVKNRCPHQGKELTDAKCEEGKIVCPYHHYAFDLNNGRGNGLYLDIYPIVIQEDGVYVEFEYFSFF